MATVEPTNLVTTPEDYSEEVARARKLAERYHVEYVDAVYNDPRGDLVPLQGGARLRIVVYVPTNRTPAHPTKLADVSGYQTFKQVAYAGSFEGQTNIGLGVRARLPFRTFVLSGPGNTTRLVIDVAHHW